MILGVEERRRDSAVASGCGWSKTWRRQQVYNCSAAASNGLLFVLSPRFLLLLVARCKAGQGSMHQTREVCPVGCHVRSRGDCRSGVKQAGHRRSEGGPLLQEPCCCDLHHFYVTPSLHLTTTRDQLDHFLGKHRIVCPKRHNGSHFTIVD